MFFKKNHVIGVLLFIFIAGLFCITDAKEVNATANTFTYTNQKTWTVYSSGKDIKSIVKTYNGNRVATYPTVTYNGIGYTDWRTFVIGVDSSKFGYSSGKANTERYFECNHFTYHFTLGSRAVKVYEGKTLVRSFNLAQPVVKMNYKGKTTFMIPIASACKGMGIGYVANGTKKLIKINTISLALKNLNTTEFFNKVAPLVQVDFRNTKIFASVTLAQMIIESGWGKTNLAQRQNNCFGIRIGTTWKSYNNIEQSIADHSYRLRYSGYYKNVTAASTPYAQLQRIEAGGYAGNVKNYANEIMRVINLYNLTKYDK